MYDRREVLVGCGWWQVLIIVCEAYHGPIQSIQLLEQGHLLFLPESTLHHALIEAFDAIYLIHVQGL